MAANVFPTKRKRPQGITVSVAEPGRELLSQGGDLLFSHRRASPKAATSGLISSAFVMQIVKKRALSSRAALPMSTLVTPLFEAY
jgi:hypothetical protein